MKLKLSPSVEQFINESCHVIDLGNGEKWYYMPYWFHKIGDGIYEERIFENLPPQVKEFIITERNKTTEP